MGLNKGRYMPGIGEIGPYHNNVASDVHRILDVRVTFFSPTQQKLNKIREGSQVLFDLVPQNPAKYEPATRMLREDRKTHKVFVFPLCTYSNSSENRFWISWHEAWLKQNSINFVLLNAGWTLFEGLPGDQEKNQVLRVDWDQLPHRGSERAGHPHWHFDHELFISDKPDRIEIAPDLVQVPSEEPFVMRRETSLGFIHLAMGAWYENKEHPECWQRTYNDDCRQLRNWCTKTLRYLKEQIGEN
jgi:hypothetical protein